MTDRTPPRPADGQRIYAIGDIHGCADLLDRMIELILEHSDKAEPVREERLVLLGDYVDRGPDSHGVVERLLSLLPRRFQTDFLMGNHERMLIDALEDAGNAPLWVENGATTTLVSYALAIGLHHDPFVLLEGAMPERHAAFYRALRLHVTHGDYLFVHAGIRPGVDLARQTGHDLLWIREPFLGHPGPHDKVVVHGHTPTERPELGRWRIGIDTGAFFSGHLTALVLEGEQQSVLMT